MSGAAVQIGRVAIRGGLVTGTAQAIKIAIQFASVVVLARLLAPEDFGLIASVGPIVAFVGLFQNLGLQQAVIQRKAISRRQLNQVFWVTALVGLVSTLAIAALSPLVAMFYGDPRMVLITIAAGLPLFLGSMSALPLSLMNRNLQFGQLAVNDVLVSIASFATAACAAYAGFGYWSLLLGSAASTLVAMAAAWTVVRWKPGRPEWRLDRDILSFGANLTGFNLVNFFARNLDNILIGRFAGPVALGYYDRGYKLLLFPLQNINQPLTRVMIPLMSRIQEDKTRFRDIYLRTNWLLALVTMPGIAALTLISNEVVGLLFGARWAPVAPIFAWLGIAGLIQPVSSTTGWIFICQGRTSVMFRWGIYAASTTVLSFFIGLHWGVVGVAAAYAISGYLLRTPVLTVLIHRVGPVRAQDFLMIQGLFVSSAILTWIAYEAMPTVLTGGNAIAAIATAICLSYAIAAALAFIFPRSRDALMHNARNLLGTIR